MPPSSIEHIIQKLQDYKKKFYKNRLLKGSILSLSIISLYYILVNSIEYFGHLGTSARMLIFFSFILLLLLILGIYILHPLLFLLSPNKQISNADAAKQIGKFFPEINDKLINTLQLNTISSEDDSLIKASIEQRSKRIKPFTFTKAIDYGYNKKYLKLLIIPLLIILIILSTNHKILTEGTKRIVHYNKEYIPEAPFSFILQNKNLSAYRNEDITLQVKLSGDYLPQNIYIVLGKRRIKMRGDEIDLFSHNFQNIQGPITFKFEGAGYFSKSYTVKLLNRSNIQQLDIQLEYPSYLKLKNQGISNLGNLTVPQGTVAHWQLKTQYTQKATSLFHANLDTVKLIQNRKNDFSFNRQLNQSEKYQLCLSNNESPNKTVLDYQIEIIKDQYPSITFEQYRDTTLYTIIAMGGNISDDYGLTRLQLHYKIIAASQKIKTTGIIYIPINTEQNNQSYFYHWSIDTFRLKENEKVEYYLSIWDNDGIHGSKYSRTAKYLLSMPSKSELKEQMEKSSQGTKTQMDKTLKKIKDLKKDIKNTEDKLKGKKKLEWQDKKAMEELLKKKKEIEEEVKKLQEQYENFMEEKKKFSKNDEKIKEKVAQLQELMENLLDEETKKLYEELQKLLEEQNSEVDDFKEVLDQMEQNEENLMENLDRTLELFKKLQVEQKLDDIAKDLNELAEKQEQLSDESSNKSEEGEALAKKQEELNKEFEAIQKEIDDMHEKNQELENPESLTDTNEQEKSINEEQQKSLQKLQDNKQKPASKSQKSAADKLKQLAEQMMQMQMNMEMTQLDVNIQQLRDILDNLNKISFEQEDLLQNIKNVHQSDPRYVDISQKQLNLGDNAQILEDSLRSLAKRVFQIASFITRELESMNSHLDRASEQIKARLPYKAQVEQQFAMTAMNNLALLLDDVKNQMQQQMSDGMGGGQQKNQKGEKKSPSPGLSELQKQLNEQIERIKGGGKSGKALSQELARLASEQERIRRAMQKAMQKNDNGKPSSSKQGNNDLIQKMEETEKDLVNKQITQETIQRQKEILTRLLESEDAMRQREQEQKREAEQAKEKDRPIPDAFKEYIKAKEKEIELLKTVPPKFNLFYKQEVNKYFKRIGQQQ